MTVFLAVVAHALVILGVTFVREESARRHTNTLDVVLVQHESKSEPDEAELLAQANQDGGGESESKARPVTPLPAPFAGPRAEIVAASPPLPPLEPVARAPTRLAPPKSAPDEPASAKLVLRPILAQTKRLSPQKVATRPVVESEPKPDPMPSPKRIAKAESKAEPTPPPKSVPAPTKTLTAAALVSRSLAMASLTAEIDQRLKAYAARPKRKWITSRTKQHKYASYMEAWRQKVERIGNLNYPDEARRRKLSGTLLLDVALNTDGTVNEIILRRSSGKRVLDDAAMRIVKLAAPFARFPKSISEEIDILHIERTWQFLSSNRFASR